jgi:hypothetical protein
MTPKTLPYDILAHIASFADADTRRAMGFPPRPLSPTILVDMNNKLTKKYASQYFGLRSTLQFISKDPDTKRTKAC